MDQFDSSQNRCHRSFSLGVTLSKLAKFTVDFCQDGRFIDPSELTPVDHHLAANHREIEPSPTLRVDQLAYRVVERGECDSIGAVGSNVRNSTDAKRPQ